MTVEQEVVSPRHSREWFDAVLLTIRCLIGVGTRWNVVEREEGGCSWCVGVCFGGRGGGSDVGAGWPSEVEEEYERLGERGRD
jgi:hypothetical protein